MQAKLHDLSQLEQSRGLDNSECLVGRKRLPLSEHLVRAPGTEAAALDPPVYLLVCSSVTWNQAGVELQGLQVLQGQLTLQEAHLDLALRHLQVERTLAR